MTSLSGSLSLLDTAIPGNAAGAECASQHKVISWFSSCEMHYQRKNHYMNDSCLAGNWHYPQQTLCQSWWGWEWRQLCPCCSLTWLGLWSASLQPLLFKRSLFTSLHLDFVYVYIVLCQVEDVLTARTFVYESAALPLKISFGCCQAVDWGTSLTLLPTPAGASPHSSSSALLPHCPVVQCVEISWVWSAEN